MVAMFVNELGWGPSIDASYQVSVHLAKRFQSRRFKCEKLTDDRCQMMAKAHMAFQQIFDIFSSDEISLLQCIQWRLTDSMW